MVEIEINGERATIKGGVWTAPRASVAQALNDDVAVRPATFAYEPWPDMAIAQEVIQRYGGRIVSQEKPEFIEGRVY